jgi:hypothetical protein
VVVAQILEWPLREHFGQLAGKGDGYTLYKDSADPRPRQQLRQEDSKKCFGMISSVVHYQNVGF